ncbi:MAG: hypothetical protein JWQ33_3165 [Ramlibacter sp.]|nr:hypothetical protein [Ramlibacter sp.]
MGQMLRGGRSGPPEMKLGAAAAKEGKETVFNTCDGARTGRLLTMPAAEQHPAQSEQASALDAVVEVPSALAALDAAPRSWSACSSPACS